MAMAFIGSGSGLFAFTSLKISAVAYGDDDHMMRKRGKERVSNTSFDWRMGEEKFDGSSGLGCFLKGYLFDAFAYDLISPTIWKHLQINPKANEEKAHV
jgi:hypothetical protein